MTVFHQDVKTVFYLGGEEKKENYKFLKMLAIFQLAVLKFILIIVLVSVPSGGKKGKNNSVQYYAATD